LEILSCYDSQSIGFHIIPSKGIDGFQLSLCLNDLDHMVLYSLHFYLFVLCWLKRSPTFIHTPLIMSPIRLVRLVKFLGLYLNPLRIFPQSLASKFINIFHNSKIEQKSLANRETQRNIYKYIKTNMIQYELDDL